MEKKIKVLVVDDSMLFRKVLIDSLSKHNDIEVVGYAIDAFDAKAKIPVLRPDVVTLDVEMPRLNGIAFLKQLIPQHPVPVVVVSSLNINVFEALSAGAVDFVRKPDMTKQTTVDAFLKDLAGKVRIASKAIVHQPKPREAVRPAMPSPLNSAKLKSMVIAIGASTGGTEATLTVLKDLPPDTPGIVVVQHMPEGFTKMYAERLDRLCAMRVKEAKSGDAIVRGQVLIAPGGELQTRVVRQGSGFAVTCLPGDKVSGHRPSVDVLFTSVAENVGKNSVGIIMTGMGRDGADGLLKMKKNGAFTIGQDKESCIVYGMPMVAQNIGAVEVQASCDNIAGVLRRHLVKIQ